MTTMRCGGYQGAASVHTRGLAVLGSALARLSGGAITVTVTPDVTADGSKATELLTRVEGGTLDVCYFASSYLAGRVPALSVFDLPFAMPDRDVAYQALDGELGGLVANAVRDTTGFDVLGFWDNGFRHISNRLHPITHPRDCPGLSIRTLDNQLHQEVFSSLGFRPVTIDVRDLAEAVRSQQIDAQENPLTNTVNFGLHRTHGFHSLTGHFFGVALLLVNRAWHDALAHDERTMLGHAAAEATRAQREFAAAEDVRCLALLRESGVEVLMGDALDLAAFERAVSHIRRKELQRLIPALQRALERPGLCPGPARASGPGPHSLATGSARFDP